MTTSCQNWNLYLNEKRKNEYKYQNVWNSKINELILTTINYVVVFVVVVNVFVVNIVVVVIIIFFIIIVIIVIIIIAFVIFVGWIVSSFQFWSGRLPNLVGGNLVTNMIYSITKTRYAFGGKIFGRCLCSLQHLNISADKVYQKQRVYNYWWIQFVSEGFLLQMEDWKGCFWMNVKSLPWLYRFMLLVGFDFLTKKMKN